jgi:hypothetical protein
VADIILAAGRRTAEALAVRQSEADLVEPPGGLGTPYCIHLAHAIRIMQASEQRIRDDRALIDVERRSRPTPSLRRAQRDDE